jgi:hypothetical protein
MKAYLVTTGVIFALITVAHVWRAVVESQVARDPWYVLLTLAVASLAVWAAVLLRRWPAS